MLLKKNLLSVIIPVKKGTNINPILSSLVFLPKETEILFVSSTTISPPQSELWEKLTYLCEVQFLQSEEGRAQAMNLGAKKAKNHFLWFLHLDFQFDRKLVKALIKKITHYPNKLIYSNLKFINKGTKLTYLNMKFAWLRSRLLRLPFGDQGFCISKENFKFLGTYNETVSKGADHLFIWQAHIKKIKLSCTGLSITSSNEKYRNGQWLKTTLHYQKLWMTQAIVQLFHLLKSRLKFK